MRVEENGVGLLIVNASTVLHLNEIATEYAYYIVNGISNDEVVDKISKRYQNVNKSKTLEDFTTFKTNIEGLITQEDLDPVQFMGFDRVEAGAGNLSAPFRLDCALTYATSKNVNDPRIPMNRVSQNLDTDSWKKIIQSAYEQGIPHLLFTGGEPTERDDLIELLQLAEDLGMVTGLLTDGKKLADSSYLNQVLTAGLDHTMIILQPDDEESWESLSTFAYWKEALDEDLYISVHLTITEDNKNKIGDLIERIANSGVHALSLSATTKKLVDVMREAEDMAFYQGIELVSDMPVPFSSLNPVSLDSNGDYSYLEKEFSDGDVEDSVSEGKLSLYIEPDGDVTPSQSNETVLGNMLSDSWKTIWTKAKNWNISH